MTNFCFQDLDKLRTIETNFNQILELKLILKTVLQLAQNISTIFYCHMHIMKYTFRTKQMNHQTVLKLRFKAPHAAQLSLNSVLNCFDKFRTIFKIERNLKTML